MELLSVALAALAFVSPGNRDATHLTIPAGKSEVRVARGGRGQAPDDEGVSRDDEDGPERVVRQPHEVGECRQAGELDAGDPRPGRAVDDEDGDEHEQR